MRLLRKGVVEVEMDVDISLDHLAVLAENLVG
jgi:hypothetical protein